MTAQEIADVINGHPEFSARVWYGRSATRVYVKRFGYRDSGFVQVDEDEGTYTSHIKGGARVVIEPLLQDRSTP